eukprot:Em0001g3298a
MSDSVREGHEVTFNIDIVIGVNPAQTSYNSYETIRDGQRKRIYEAILPDHTFHLEYNLLPSGHESMRFKTDVVTFGVVCKVHTDKDSRVIKAWEENGADVLCLATQDPDMVARNAYLLSMSGCGIQRASCPLGPGLTDQRPSDCPFRIQSRASHRTQTHDRQSFRWYPTPTKAVQGESNTVQELCNGSSLALTSTAGSSMVVPGVEPSQVMSGMGSSLAVPGMETSLVVVEEVGGGTPQAKPSNIMAGFTPVSPYALQALPTTTITLTKAEAAEDARVEREGLAMLPLPLASLYGHSPTLTSTLPQGRVDLRDMRVTLEVEESLMATPLTTSEAIDERTSGQERGGANAVSWNETKVTLLGTRDHAHLLEYLRGPPLTLELHDRDRRATPPPARSLYGRRARDHLTGTQTYCRDKRGASSPYPYGVAKLDLSELLLGQRLIEVRLPILNCPNTCHQGDAGNRANLLDTVNEINGRALGLTGFGRVTSSYAALSTCKLTSLRRGMSRGGPGGTRQRRAQGRMGGAGGITAAKLRRSCASFTIPSALFSTRLYGALDVDNHGRHDTAADQRAGGCGRLFTREGGVVPEPCFRALLRLSDLKRAREMTDIVRNDLLPSADEIVSLSANFSVPFPSQQQHLNEVSSVGSAPMEVSGGRPATPGPGDRSRQRLPWEPLDLTNPGYELVLAGRRKSAMATDFVQHTVPDVVGSGTWKHEERKAAVDRKVRGIQLSRLTNYSIQALNSTEMGKARLRARLSRDLKHRYTYSRDFLGATAAPFDHPRAPHSSRVEELREAFQDLWLRATTQKPTADRNHDFDLYTRAPAHFGPAPPVSIHLAGDRRKEELGEKEREEEERWRARVVVDHLDFRVHRKPVSVELKERGPGASNQLDRLCGLLKDPPYKHSLLGGEGLGPRSCLGKRHSPPGCEEDAPRGGYQPGPLLSRSLKLDKNVVPIRVSRGACHEGTPQRRCEVSGCVLFGGGGGGGGHNLSRSVPELKSMDLLSVS